MKESIAQLYHLCEDWKRELQFYKDEIPVLKQRLDEVASKNTGNEIMLKVSHFENKFKIMNQNMDELLHDVNLKIESLRGQAEAKPNYINVKMIEHESALEDLMHITASDFYDTKKEYYKFLSSAF